MTAKKKATGGSRLRVTLVGGWAGKSQNQQRNLRALGLRRSGDVRELPDTPDIRGKVDKVSHLVTAEPVEGGASGR